MMQEKKPGNNLQDDEYEARDNGATMTPLGGNYKLNDGDVLVGRGKLCRYVHPGDVSSIALLELCCRYFYRFR
jgi:hypothetical protein